MRSFSSVNVLLVCILLLLLFDLSEQKKRHHGGSSRRRRSKGHGNHGNNGGHGNKKPPIKECGKCFTSSTCFMGGAAENVSTNCTDCIKNHGIQPTFLPKIGTLKSFWNGICKNQCPAWSISFTREKSCIDCLWNCNELCRRKCKRECNKRSPWLCKTCVTACHKELNGKLPEKPKPCHESCRSNTSCFDQEEIKKTFSTFCLDYVYISCKSNKSDECAIAAMKEPCSKCNLSSSNLQRINNCKNCLDSCNKQTSCIQDCTKSNYPTSPVSCYVCAHYCNREGRREISDNSTCTVNAVTCPTCDTCTRCYDACVENNKGDFVDRPNNCQDKPSFSKRTQFFSLLPSFHPRPCWIRPRKYKKTRN